MVRLSALKSARNRRGSSADRIEIAASRIAAGQPSVGLERLDLGVLEVGTDLTEDGSRLFARHREVGGADVRQPAPQAIALERQGRVGSRRTMRKASRASRQVRRSPSGRRVEEMHVVEDEDSGSARAADAVQQGRPRSRSTRHHEVVGSERDGARRARSRSTAAVAPARCRPRRARPNGSSALPWRCGPSRREASSAEACRRGDERHS